MDTINLFAIFISFGPTTLPLNIGGNKYSVGHLFFLLFELFSKKNYPLPSFLTEGQGKGSLTSHYVHG